MSDIIEFPGPPNRPITENETDKLHAEAFRVLEGRISDCVIMAGIAAQRALPLATTHTRQAVATGEAASVGTLPATQRLNLSIVLPLRDAPALQALLTDLYDPHSPRYRHYLSVQDFTDRFGPSQADYDAVYTTDKPMPL